MIFDRSNSAVLHPNKPFSVSFCQSSLSQYYFPWNFAEDFHLFMQTMEEKE